jgi:hypothetical protein
LEHTDYRVGVDSDALHTEASAAVNNSVVTGFSIIATQSSPLLKLTPQIEC